MGVVIVMVQRGGVFAFRVWVLGQPPESGRHAVPKRLINWHSVQRPPYAVRARPLPVQSVHPLVHGIQVSVASSRYWPLGHMVIVNTERAVQLGVVSASVIIALVFPL